jgi:arylsulfatase A-like enzyme
MGLRGDAIVEFDWSVGEILDALDELGIADNTLVILTSDNGPVIDDGYEDRAEELLGGHNPSGDLRGRKYSAFEAGTTVPMIVRWPAKVKGGVTSDALYSQIDLMASLGELWDARLPKGSARDSRKHLDALLGTDGEGCDFVVGQAQNRSLTVRTKEWKYIEPSDGPKMITWAPGIETGYLPLPQLFHLKKDRTEQHNVAGKYPEKVFELQHILRRLRK